MSPIPVADMGDMTHSSHQITAWLDLDRLVCHLLLGWWVHHQIFADRYRLRRLQHRPFDRLVRHQPLGWWVRHQIFAGRYHQSYRQKFGYWKPRWL